MRTITTFGTGPDIALLQVGPSPVYVGDAATGTVTLSEAAPTGGVVVSLTSKNELVTRVPATVLVAAGSTSATFAVTTEWHNIPAVVIHAFYQGSTATTTLSIYEKAHVASLTFDRSVIDSGGSATGTVTVAGVVPQAGSASR